MRDQFVDDEQGQRVDRRFQSVHLQDVTAMNVIGSVLQSMFTGKDAAKNCVNHTCR